MLTPKTRKRPLLRPKKTSTAGAFSLELQDGDRIHFLSDTDCEVRRGDTVLGRYRHAYDDDTSDVLEKKGKADLKLVPGAENKKSEPLQAGERWITLKPQGPDSNAYVRVKIRQHPDGTASVIGGAGGKLNQLHLNKLRSPEEWKAGAAERRAKREERERKRQEAQSEAERAEEETKVKEAREYHRNEKHQNALETLKALDEAGIDLGLSEEHRDALAVPPAPDTDPEEAKRVEALARDALKTVEKVHQAYEQKLITDHEARAAAKLGDTALDGLGNPLQQGLDHSAYGADGGEISSITQLPNGQWLVRSPNGADQSFDDWEKAAKAHAGNVAEHDSTTGERSQEDDFYNPKLWVRQHEDLPEGFKFDVTVAGKIAALAQGRKEIDRSAKNAEKAIKKGQPWNAKKGADVQGTVIDDKAAIAALESDAKTIEDAIVHGRLLDLADILDPKELKKHLGTGGLAQLGEIASDVLKANPVDPALVQQLGHNEAAKLLAYQMRQSMSEGEYEAVVAAQGAWHGEWSTRYAQEVIDRNQPLVDQLSAIHKRMLEIESERGQVKPAEDVTLDLFGGGGDEPDPYAGDVDTDYTPDQLIELDNLAYQSRALQDTLNKDIGTALGQLQASAAMTLALESKPRSLRFAVDGDNVNVEDVPGLFSRETPDGESKPSIWAHYGLGADDFDLQDGPDGQLVSVKPSGMEKLAGASYDPADREEYERAIAIKRGEFDEENFTPDGFAYRPAQTFTDVRTEAQQFDTTLNYSPEMSDDELIESMKQYIGARVANGDNPVVVHKDLLSPETYLKMGMGQTETYRAIDVLDSFDRKQFVDDDGNLLINDRRIRDFYRELGEIEAGRQRTALGTNDVQSLHTQTLDPEIAKEAAHRALAAMPMGKAAMKPLEQLTPRERKYLREYAITEIMGEDLIKNPDDNENTEQPKGGDVQSGLLSSNLSKKQERAINALRGKKDKLYIDFLTPSKNISKEDYDTEVAKVNEQIRQIEDNTLNPDEFIPKQSLPTQWQNFSKIVGGDAKAYELVRDKLKGQFLSRFSSAYGSIQGKPLLTGYQVAAHVDRLMAATLPKDEREELLAHVRSLHSSDIAKVRERNRGKFAVELDDVLEKYEKLKGADRQISLISMDSGVSSGFVPRNEKERLEQEEKNKKNQKSDDKNGEWQRTILGEAAERQLDQILTEVLPGFAQLDQDEAIAIRPEVRWNGNFVAHQRGLKFLQERKKIGMHYSAGAGKSAGMLGAFTHLHSQGAVQRSIVAVPSSIVGQIVGECATFLEPGKYNYSANMGWDREKRIEALKNPDLHLHFTTRESLANDLLHLVERHTGVSPEDFQNTDARSEDDRRALMLTALKNEGIDPQGLLFSVDEAHDLSRRRGVAASKRSLALDALAYHSGHYIHATGSPLKNDVSEIADFLQKVGAPEAADMGAFMARYGKNTEANARALQRIMAKYSYAIAVKPTKDGEDLDMRHHKPRIELTEHQKIQRQTLKGHYETIRKWKEANLKQAMAAKVERGDKTPLNGADLAHAWDDPGVREAIAALSSEDYGKLTEEEKQAKIGGQILGASAIHHTALKRLYDRAPYEHNAKAQHVVAEAKKAVAAGKPGVVFCTSAEAAKMLRDQMEKEGLRVAHADGTMGSKDKDKARLKFDPGPSGEAKADILIVTDCMQTGVNLQRGKVLWHYDVPDTQKAFEQRSARIYRRGQTEDVDVVNVMADAPEDEIALARMERKAGQSEIFQGYDPTLGHAEVIDDSGLALEIAKQKALMNQGEQSSTQMAA